MQSHSAAGYGLERTLLTRQEVAERLGVSSRTVARFVSRGELARVKLGRVARFREADVRALIERSVTLSLNDEAPDDQIERSVTSSMARHGHHVLEEE